MNNMTVRAKLVWTFGGISLMVLLIAGLALKSLGDANERFMNYVAGINARANTAHLVREAVDLRAIAVRRRIRRYQLRILHLERSQLLKQAVIFSIRNARLIQHVIPVCMLV